MKYARRMAAAAAAALLLVSSVPAAGAEKSGNNEDGGEEYTMQLSDEAVTVSADGEENMTDIDPQLLREEDRRLLSEGVTVESYAEILGLIEDFNS